MHVQCRKASCIGLSPVPRITGVKFICTCNVHVLKGLESHAIVGSCKEQVLSNSCPIFTLAAEQVVIHCITTAHQNAKLVSISSSRADRSYTFSLYFAHREQVQNLYLAHRELVQTLQLGAPQHCTLLTASECKASLWEQQIPQKPSLR